LGGVIEKADAAEKTAEKVDDLSSAEKIDDPS
jgi:hypothetical protein